MFKQILRIQDNEVKVCNTSFPVIRHIHVHAYVYTYTVRFFFSGYGKIIPNFYRTTTSLSIHILGEIFCCVFNPNYLKYLG